MDPKRQNAPTVGKSYLLDRDNFKQEIRKRSLREMINNKRNPKQTINGYNLSMRWRKRKYKIKRCWVCGETDHFKADCPIHWIKQLIKRVVELEKRLQNIEESIYIQQKKQNKKMKKKKRN